MTREIGARLGKVPVVTPVFEGPGRFAPWESGLLEQHGSRGYIREVVLSINDARVLSARTLSTFGDPAVEVLRTLGDRPLAQVLFEDARWQRITAHIPLIELGRRRVGRACVWQYGAPGAARKMQRPSRILVEEFFEPALG
jgi:chorismate-pyruvate lyase